MQCDQPQRRRNDIGRSARGTRDVGDVLLSFPWPGGSSCWGICDDGENLWITNATASPTTIFEVHV